jgi:Cyclin, N-terminal domain
VADTFPPSIETVEGFILNIFKMGQLQPEAIIMMVAYIHRIEQSDPSFALAPNTWRRLVFIGLVVASKVWEDQAVWNVDFIELFPYATPKDVNSLEGALLNLLSFDLSVDASEYAKAYFDLRSEAQLSADEDFANLGRLSRGAGEMLGVRSKKFTVDIVQRQKAMSFDAGASGPLLKEDT